MILKSEKKVLNLLLGSALVPLKKNTGGVFFWRGGGGNLNSLANTPIPRRQGGGDNGYGIWGFMFETERGGVEGCYHSYVIYFWLIYDSAPGHVTK